MRSFENEVLISPGERNILEVLLGSAFFAILLFLIIMMGYNYFSDYDIYKALDKTIHIVSFSGFLITMGLRFLMVKDIIINKKDNYLISRYRVGGFKKDFKSKLPNLSYIAIFKNTNYDFEANLWYGKNKHYKMYVFNGFGKALNFANIIANKLELDILDATVKGDFKWLN